MPVHRLPQEVYLCNDLMEINRLIFNGIKGTKIVIQFLYRNAVDKIFQILLKTLWRKASNLYSSPWWTKGIMYILAKKHNGFFSTVLGLHKLFCTL